MARLLLLLAAHASAALALSVQTGDGRLVVEELQEPVKLWQEDFLWHMLVSPEHKLMACKNYKAGSSEVSELFSTLWRDPDRVSLHRDHNFNRSDAGCEWFTQKWRDYPVDQPAPCRGPQPPQEAITLHQFKPIDTNASQMVDQTDWFKVMVARDPLDRFISGILDKCGILLNASGACPAKKEALAFLDHVGGGWPNVSNSTREANEVRQAVMILVIEKLEEKAYQERQKGKHWGYADVDPHFRPPSSMCGAGSGLKFDDVILYDPRNFSNQVETLLRTIGAKDPDGLRRDFDSLGNNNQDTSSAYRTAADRVEDMLTPDIARRLIWLYAEDYAMFPIMRLHIPGWVDISALPDFDDFEASVKKHYSSPMEILARRPLKSEMLSFPKPKVDMSAEED